MSQITRLAESRARPLRQAEMEDLRAAIQSGRSHLIEGRAVARGILIGLVLSFVIWTMLLTALAALSR
jgi:hypothetical protein